MGGYNMLQERPVFGLAGWFGLTLLERVPHLYHYIGLMAENAERQSRNAVQMINVIKNEIVLIFAYLSGEMIQSAQGRLIGLGVWGVPVMLLLLIATLVYFLRRGLRLR
jgi:hypothetical protein